MAILHSKVRYVFFAPHFCPYKCPDGATSDPLATDYSQDAVRSAGYINGRVVCIKWWLNGSDWDESGYERRGRVRVV